MLVARKKQDASQSGEQQSLNLFHSLFLSFFPPLDQSMHAGSSRSDAATQDAGVITASKEDMPSSSAPSHDGDSSLILRIKRKRGTDPISALRIESLLSQSTTKDDAEGLRDAADIPVESNKRRQTDRGESPVVHDAEKR